MTTSTATTAEKLAKVREALETDKRVMEALMAERDKLKAEVERLRAATTTTAATATGGGEEAVKKLRDENADLKGRIERMQYRIDHLCTSLDELNARAGTPPAVIAAPAAATKQ
jgi:chromosome segregation ATPase